MPVRIGVRGLGDGRPALAQRRAPNSVPWGDKSRCQDMFISPCLHIPISFSQPNPSRHLGYVPTLVNNWLDLSYVTRYRAASSFLKFRYSEGLDPQVGDLVRYFISCLSARSQSTRTSPALRNPRLSLSGTDGTGRDDADAARHLNSSTTM